MLLVAVLPVVKATRLSICVWADPHIEFKAAALGHSGHSLAFKERLFIVY